MAAAEALHLLALQCVIELHIDITHLSVSRASKEEVVKWADEFITALSSPSENVTARRGLVLGLGVLPWHRATDAKVRQRRLIQLEGMNGTHCLVGVID